MSVLARLWGAPAEERSVLSFTAGDMGPWLDLQQWVTSTYQARNGAEQLPQDMAGIVNYGTDEHHRDDDHGRTNDDDGQSDNHRGHYHDDQPTDDNDGATRRAGLPKQRGHGAVHRHIRRHRSRRPMGRSRLLPGNRPPPGTPLRWLVRRR